MSLGAVVCAVVGSLGWSVFAAESTVPPAASGNTLQAAIQRLAARQKSVKTVRYQWVHNKLYRKGTCLVADTVAGGLRESGLPEEDTTIDQVISVEIDGSKIHITRQGLEWNSSRKRFGPHEEAMTYVDGVTRRLFTKPGFSVSIVKGNSLSRQVNLMPILCAYRLFNPDIGLVRMDEVQLVGESIAYKGHPCTVIEQQAHGTLRRWWLAEDMEFSPVQMIFTTVEGRPLVHIEMEYQEAKQGTWELSSWTTAMNPSLESAETSGNQATVKAINEPIDLAVFEFEIPLGAEVNDEIAGIEYIAGTPDEGPVDEAGLDELKGAFFSRWYVWILVSLIALAGLLFGIRVARKDASRSERNRQ